MEELEILMTWERVDFPEWDRSGEVVTSWYASGWQASATRWYGARIDQLSYGPYQYSVEGQTLDADGVVLAYGWVEGGKDRPATSFEAAVEGVLALMKAQEGAANMGEQSVTVTVDMEQQKQAAMALQRLENLGILREVTVGAQNTHVYVEASMTTQDLQRVQANALARVRWENGNAMVAWGDNAAGRLKAVVQQHMETTVQVLDLIADVTGRR